MSERRDLLESWKERARASQFAHYQYAAQLANSHYWLGVPVVAITAIVGGVGVSGTLLMGDANTFLLGGGALLGSVLAAIQTFLRSAERAGEHRSTGARYGAVRRHIEQLTADWESREASEHDVSIVRERLDTLAQEAPNVPQSAWLRAQRISARS